MKKLFIFISSLLAYPFLATPVFAETPANPCSGAAGIAAALCNLSGANGGNIVGTIRGVVVFVVVLAIIVALLYLLYGGIKWITSKGEKTEVESARNHIMAAITGLIIVFLAIFIVSIVLAAFGLNLGSISFPSISNTAPTGQ